MTAFLLLTSKIFPLYILIVCGYIAKRFLHTERESIAKLVIYLVAPVVYFHGALKADFSHGLLLMPLIIFIFCLILGILALHFGKWLFPDSRANILGFSAGTANSGYFGLPVALILFGEQAYSPIIVGTLGILLFENTLGFYFAARAHFSVMESIKKLVRLPALYAFTLGAVLNVMAFQLPEQILPLMDYFRGTYSVLGMMIIGLCLGEFKREYFDWKFIGATLIPRFILWPLGMLGVIGLDRMYFHLFSGITPQILFLLSIVPLGANLVAFATILRVHPEKTAMAVLVSTLFALVFIPAMTMFVF